MYAAKTDPRFYVRTPVTRLFFAFTLCMDERQLLRLHACRRELGFLCTLNSKNVLFGIASAAFLLRPPLMRSHCGTVWLVCSNSWRPLFSRVVWPALWCWVESMSVLCHKVWASKLQPLYLMRAKLPGRSWSHMVDFRRRGEGRSKRCASSAAAPELWSAPWCSWPRRTCLLFTFSCGTTWAGIYYSNSRGLWWYRFAEMLWLQESECGLGARVSESRSILWYPQPLPNLS